MAAGWGSFLVAIAGPVAKRVLTAIGFGTVTFLGMSAALNSALSSARSAWGGMGADVAAFMAIAGVNTACSILAGALVARLSLEVAKRLVPK